MLILKKIQTLTSKVLIINYWEADIFAIFDDVLVYYLLDANNKQQVELLAYAITAYLPQQEAYLPF